jgi:hypothetical protein
MNQTSFAKESSSIISPHPLSRKRPLSRASNSMDSGGEDFYSKFPDYGDKDTKK